MEMRETSVGRVGRTCGRADLRKTAIIENAAATGTADPVTMTKTKGEPFFRLFGSSNYY